MENSGQVTTPWTDEDKRRFDQALGEAFGWFEASVARTETALDGLEARQKLLGQVPKSDAILAYYRNAALEVAVKVCDRIAGEQGECAQVAYDCGDAIRAMKT